MRRAQRVIAVLSCLAALCAAALGLADARAHGDVTAVVDISSLVQGDRRRVRLRVQLVLEHWLAARAGAASDQDDEAAATLRRTREAALRALSPEALGAAFDVESAAFLTAFTLEVDGEPIALRLTEVDTPPTEGTDFPRYTMITLEGAAAAARAGLATLGWDDVDGFVVRDGPWDMRQLHRTRFAHYVEAGARSPEMALDARAEAESGGSLAWSPYLAGALVTFGVLGFAYICARHLR